MSSKFKVTLVHEEEINTLNVMEHIGIGNKEVFTKLAITFFCEAYAQKVKQMEEEDESEEMVQDEEGS